MEEKDIVLESKIQTPTASRNFLVRERLIRRLNDAEERLIIVSAGMGYGKTVLLTHYAKRYPEKCAWYHLSETDNDIMVFARYLHKSVAKVAPEFEPDFSPYMALDQNEALVRDLALDFAALFRALEGREVCLVLDDFQVIENDWIFQFLNIILDNQPGGLRLFLCTKSAPPAFCARYLLERSAMVLGADSLAFDLEEVKLLIGEYTVPENLERVAQAVQAHMEGWPAGVSFTVLYFRQRQSKMSEQELDQACQQSYLRDYLMHELFRKLPFELQNFLTSTSVLDYLRPDVCNALTGGDNAAGQLSYLERENLFILHLSGGGHIYRYHTLFRNFLTGQLQPGRRLQLLRRASDFYLHTPDKAQAAEYAIDCADGDRLQSAVETAGREALAQGSLNTLRRWLEELRALGTPPTPEILLLRGQYGERTGDWRGALDMADRVVGQSLGSADERCVLEARLLQARVTREQLSVQKSLEILEQIMPRLRPERAALSPLRRQAEDLRMHNLLDLRQYDRALGLVLSGLEESVRRRDAEAQAWDREMAVVCYFVMGAYRQAMQFYVILRGGGAGGGAAPYIDLYLAVSGRARQAVSQFSRTQEELPEEASRHDLESLLLIQVLVERLAALEGGGSAGPADGKSAWEFGALYRSFSGRGFGDLSSLLLRAVTGEAVGPREEDALFHLESGEFITIQDGARWLAVRRQVLKGERARALELCRRTGPDRAAWRGEEADRAGGRVNAFLAFLTLEEALLLLDEDREEAAALVERCAPYLLENRLICPGLTAEESAALKALFPQRGPDSAPLPDPALSGPDRGGAEKPGRVTIRAFGRFRALLPDGQELHWRTRKAQELFAYLFHLNGAFADRDRLMDILWPQSAPANATSLLHTSLYSIRKSLTPYGLDRLIQREKKGYRMDIELVDADREQVDAICRGEREDGTDLPALYEGPYLEDIEAAWTEDSRAWYAGAFLRACRSMAEKRMDRDDFQGAAVCLRAAIRQEPYDETLAAMLIRCYAVMGEVKNAMALYNRLKEILAEDLGAEPGEAVTRTYKECLLRRLNSGRAL